jgi:hypothetical protein
LANPATFEQAVAVAGQVDDILFSQRSYPARQDFFRPRSFARSDNQPIPMELGAINKPKERPTQTKTLSPERMSEIRNGLCFYCKEPGHMAVRCPKKKVNAPANYRDRR